ncbi:MAG: hypothetical protein SO119_00820 [Phascolarctobacterium sp.]|nr:hypothetical protein [Phascolarctobacterium sp.]
MAQPSQSLFRRIRSIRSSLDNAEQSFLDNKDIRGELDLMLAEAELKNLRKKKDVPWSWNRHLLAACSALIIVLAGCGGWYFARDHYKQRARAANISTTATVTVQQGDVAQLNEAAGVEPQIKNAQVIKSDVKPTLGDASSKEHSQVTISKADMHKLVQSARVELNSSK